MPDRRLTCLSLSERSLADLRSCIQTSHHHFQRRTLVVLLQPCCASSTSYKLRVDPSSHCQCFRLDSFHMCKTIYKREWAVRAQQLWQFAVKPSQSADLDVRSCWHIYLKVDDSVSRFVPGCDCLLYHTYSLPAWSDCHRHPRGSSKPP